MKVRALSVVTICSSIFLANSVLATSQTPTARAACIFEPYAFSWPWPMSQRDSVGTALYNQDYGDSLAIRYDAVFDAHAEVTLDDFKEQLRRGLGAFFLFTHGGVVEPTLAVEAYDTTDAGWLACAAAFNEYVTLGWDPDTEMDWGRSAHGWHISVRPDLVSSPSKGFVGRESIVHVCACCSWEWRDDWLGVRDYLGYTCEVDYIPCMKADAMIFWGRLDGRDGKSYREVSKATTDRWMSHQHNGDGGTVLAPTVLDYDPSREDFPTSKATFPCTVHFDCVMCPVITDWVAAGDGEIVDVDSVRWVNDTTLCFNVNPTGANGMGSVYINPYEAVSASNSAWLDGNQVPTGTDGHGPNGDQFVFQYKLNDDPAASVEFFGVEDGEVVWRTIEEEGALAFRLLGQNRGDGDSWEITSEEVAAEGAPAEYRVGVPLGWDYLKLQEREWRYRGARWIDHDICVTDPPPPGPPSEEERDGHRWLRVIGLEENVGAIEEFLDEMAAVGVQGDYEIVASISGSVLEEVFSSENAGDTLRIIWPRPEGFGEGDRGEGERRIWGVGLVGPEEFEDALLAYEVALENPSHWPPGEGFVASTYLISGAEDSATVADWIVHGHGGEYWILFGRVVECNDPDSTTMPCAYFNGAGSPVYAHCCFSLWDWERGGSDTVEKFIGYVPVDSESDLWDYYRKMVDYRWNNAWTDYGCRLGTWAHDRDMEGRSGELVRLHMESVLDLAHAGWEVDSLWGSALLRCTAQRDSALAALEEGRAIIMALGTQATFASYCQFLSSRPTDCMYADVRTLLAGSRAYSSLLSMSCRLNGINYRAGLYPRIVQELLLTPYGGAIASVGPSGSFYEDYYSMYLTEFMQTYNHEGGDGTIGQMHMRIRNDLLRDHPGDPLMPLFCKILVLVGDPTIKVGGPNSSHYLAVRQTEKLGEGSRVTLRNPVPNPFNPTVAVSFTIPEPSMISLRIYDVQGRLVRTLIDRLADPGKHQVVWDGKNERGEAVGSGIYFCRLASGREMETAKMVLLR